MKVNKNNGVRLPLHITNGNCCAACQAARVPQNRSRALPFVRFCGTTFLPAANLRFAS